MKIKYLSAGYRRNLRQLRHMLTEEALNHIEEALQEYQCQAGSKEPTPGGTAGN